MREKLLSSTGSKNIQNRKAALQIDSVQRGCQEFYATRTLTLVLRLTRRRVNRIMKVQTSRGGNLIIKHQKKIHDSEKWKVEADENANEIMNANDQTHL